ncbi:Amiloride-sensitive amine oxidase [copper-containing] [Psilocybe cubensis]|uniref:Amine oxidase n=2 Tax=Psilocybe cubensis TaxID=181762 RepID=A0A8H8CKG3_PSICU|nr:Amiloride-sensitive amine oxidase [copper-containing] [Psilocybe cubensis]KAH9482139.1 Amiloride-sensitive amine oxidase [copper-containing] [Psilocybe cubensis]
MSHSSKPVNIASPTSFGHGRYATRGYLLLIISLTLNVLLIVAIIRPAIDINGILKQDTFFGNSGHSSTGPNMPLVENASSGRCPSSTYQQASPPATVNLWASLTIPELAEIDAWVRAPERRLNLTQNKNSALSDNVIYLIEAYYPPKKEALAFLNDPHQVPRPDRYARVTIQHGGLKIPEIKDYLVGPLPIGSATKIRRLTEIYHREDIPFNAYALTNWTSIPSFMARAVKPLIPAMEDLFGGTIRGFDNDTLIAGMSGPFSFDGSFRRLWTTWRRNTAGSYLLPVNFYNYIDISGTDPSQWKILKLMYHDQIFPTVESFLEAYNNGTLVRHPEQKAPDLDFSWTQRKRVGQDRDLDELPGPRSVSFSGLRYRIDREQQYVSWLGWGMYLGFDRDMGLNLWDIRFRGQRIIYQLQPQEAIAQYGGNDPLQTSTAWLDRHFGMGTMVRDMIPHYDCPQESVYLPAITFTPQGNVQVQRAICIFEQDTGRPLSRHTGFLEGEFGAVKSYVLTIRTVTTVGKYFDYSFYLDGTIEVRLSASGYMQGGYYTSKIQEGYGGRIRHTSMGNLHDHVINYKVDFDIAGTENSLLKTTTKQEEVTHPWLDDDWGKQAIQQRINKEYIANEDDALLKYPTNFQGGYAIVNQDVRNTWGLPKGYAIHPGYSPIHNTVVGSKRLLNNANWARYNLAVSLRKETEPSSSSMWNLHLPGAPMVDFHKFFNGENITQQDLVAWINLGMHHLPQAEDSPNTKTNLATSSFLLTPLNYFDADVSMEMKNAILLHPPKAPGGSYTFDDYGVKQDVTCLPDAPAPFEYTPTKWLGLSGEPDVISPEDARRVSEMYLRVRIGA